MASQTKHRILGLLVILGLIVILFPLFENNKDSKSEVAMVNSPPFPDQAVTLDNSDIQQPIVLQNASAQDTSIPLVEINQAPQPDDDIPPAATGASASASQSNVALTDVAISELPVIDTSKSNDVAEKVITKSDATPVTTKAAVKIKTAKAKTTKLIHPKTGEQATIKKSVALIDQLSKLKQAAWVIQIGSYKNKANALRLVNQLRSNGYAAFIQDVSTEEGHHTRVYVGPEHKQNSASAVAEQIHKEMNLHGIVISYQPLAL